MPSQPRIPYGQFSLRTIMVVVLAVAAICALTAPYVRAMSELRRWLLAAQIATAFVSAAIAWLFLVRRNRRVDRLAGDRLLLAPMQTAAVTPLIRLSLLVSSIILFAISIVVMTLWSNSGQQAQQLGGSSHIVRHFCTALLVAATGGMTFGQWLYYKTSGGS